MGINISIHSAIASGDRFYDLKARCYQDFNPLRHR